LNKASENIGTLVSVPILNGRHRRGEKETQTLSEETIAKKIPIL
jgi:hypothetical protein